MKTASLVDLKDQCLKDDNCVAVSCGHNEGDEGTCSRYIFSSSCENVQHRNDWTYHFVNSSKNHFSIVLNYRTKNSKIHQYNASGSYYLIIFQSLEVQPLRCLHQLRRKQLQRRRRQQQRPQPLRQPQQKVNQYFILS